MACKMGGAMRLPLLPRVAVALSTLMGAAQGRASGGEVTVIPGTTTMTLSVLSTRTITTQTTSASAALGGTMAGGEEYVLQGCYGQDGRGDIGTLLGDSYTTRDAAAGAGGMSLSMCLGLCGSSASADHQPYLYIGVSDGKACYCGTNLDSDATQAHPEDCTVPCQGNTSVACGGHSFMSIYKLTAPAKALQDTTPVNKSINDTTTSSDNDGSSSSSSSSGGGGKPNLSTAAVVALGGISGVGILLSALVLGARQWKRRKQRHAGGGHQREPGTDTNTPPEEASIGDTTRTELRRLDGIVMDGQSSPVDGASRRTSHAGRAGEIMAAATGAEWRTASPVTPRGGAAGTGTPKPVSTVPGDEAWDDTPRTPSILVQHPDSVAPNHGLGERAWHRRRFSTPFPPPVAYDGAASAEEGSDGRDGSSSRGPRDGARPADLHPTEGLIPLPLDLPRFGRDADEVSALSDGDGAALSPRWAQWGKWALPSSSPVSGSFAREAKTSGKTGKVE